MMKTRMNLSRGSGGTTGGAARSATPLIRVRPSVSTHATLQGDDCPLEFYPDGYPMLPDCLRR